VRLHESAAVLAIPLPWEDRTIVAGIADLLAACGLDGPGIEGGPIGDAAVRVTVSRGPLERRGLLPPGWRDARPTIVVQAWPFHPPAATVIENGIRAIASTIRHDPASPLAGVKSTSRADHVYAKLEADRAGADDALFLTVDGAISEATTSNVFALVRGSFVTPPRAAGILAGTTRTWLLASSEDVEPRFRLVEADLMPDDLLRADEAFVSSSVAGIVPLVAYEGRPIGTGRPGPRTLALRAARERWIDERSLEGVPGPGRSAAP
jgi:branched-subunit amino acid aminotransferase/4-amino-4-deoxychorismate lyase